MKLVLNNSCHCVYLKKFLKVYSLWFKLRPVGKGQIFVTTSPSLPCFNLVNPGMLSVPGIAGYKWVPARVVHFDKYKIIFS